MSIGKLGGGGSPEIGLVSGAEGDVDAGPDAISRGWGDVRAAWRPQGRWTGESVQQRCNAHPSNDGD